MRYFYVKEKQTGKKIVQVLTGEFPYLPVSAVYKALRQKDIKINGLRIAKDIPVHTGDKIEIYLPDAILLGKPDLSIVWEDENLVIANKPQGLKVHPDGEANSVSLIGLLRERYGEEISLCHRLDQNTGGLLLAGKDKTATDFMAKKIKSGEVQKYYRCRVHGKLANKQERLVAYLSKNPRDSLVFIYSQPRPGAHKIITEYTVLHYDKGTDTSVLDIHLVTGKTHQIRAHLAHIGHPIVGDGKYGSNQQRKQLGEKQKYQCLFAYKLSFAFTAPAGKFEYLNHKTVEILPPISE